MTRKPSHAYRPLITIDTMTEKHLMCLRIIGAGGSYKKVAETIGTGKTFVSILVNELVQLELLDIDPNVKNGSSGKYFITKKGMAINGIQRT